MRLYIRIFVLTTAVLMGLSSLSSLTLADNHLPTNRPPDSSGSGGGAQCTTDELCKGDFCRINGLCVPKPKGNVGGLIGSSTVFEVVAIVLQWLLTLAGVVATIFLIIGGYRYITAAGNEEQAEKGKKTLINSIIGIAVVVLSIAIVTIITNTLGSTEPLGKGKLDYQKIRV